MSDQDKTVSGGSSLPSSGSPGDVVPLRSPQDATVVIPSGLGAIASPSPRRTMVGVAASRVHETVSLGAPGAARDARDPKPPSTIAGGTPPPGTTPAVAPPQGQTLQAHPRAKRSSEAPSGFSKSAWDTFDSNQTGVHATSAAPHPGVRINQYEMIKMIGEGGMGTVFLARDLRLGRRVAIKFLQSNQPELTQRFLVEARTTARCQHDNIVVIYEVGEHNGAPYIVLEYLNGKPLTEYTQNGQRMTYTRAVG